MNNTKTYRSFDTSTICPRREEGNSCPYCYVENERVHGSMYGKREIKEIPYDGMVMRMSPNTIEKLNAMGGMRMFAFSDYIPKHAAWVRQFLDECEFRGLGTKVITKVPLFIRHFHDHPAINVIHASVDSIGYGIPYARAKRDREQFAKVRVRAVCLNPEDLEWFGRQEWVDILTLNHGFGKGNNRYHRFTPEERERAAIAYGTRLCCQTHVCATCHVKCAYTPYVMFKAG